MGKGKMSGDSAADSKRGHLDRKARESGGTTKKRMDLNKNSNTKSNNTSTNRN